MLIGQRIASLISALQETPNSFSEKLGIQRSSLSHLLSARNKPSVDFLEKLLSVYPAINLTWLLIGSGNMMVEKHISTAGSTTQEENKDNVYEKESYKSSEARIDQSPQNQDMNGKSISKIIWFYQDGTFEVYNSA